MKRVYRDGLRLLPMDIKVYHGRVYLGVRYLSRHGLSNRSPLWMHGSPFSFGGCQLSCILSASDSVWRLDLVERDRKASNECGKHIKALLDLHLDTFSLSLGLCKR